MASKRPILSQSPSGKKKIDVGPVPDSREIPKPDRKLRSAWSFGFQFFAQMQYFQIGGVDNSWFISLLGRLTEISKIDRDRFLKDASQKGALRYHEIDWESKNIPIKRKDLNWIDKDYLDNEIEFPMLQFHVSKALGRVVGFWDENNVFQIVLLDPLHNIQPSKINDYHVDDTYFMSCEYSSLLIDLKKIKNKIKTETGCQICSNIVNLPTKLNNTNFVYGFISDDYIEKLKNTTLTFEELIELGLLSG